MTEAERKKYAKALEEVALAYERKRDRVQYESNDMTYLHKFLGGPFRRTDRRSPESAAKDNPLFSVCSSFMHTILWEACRYVVCDSDLRHSCTDIVNYYPEQTKYTYIAGGEVKPKRGFRECLEALEPGDFIVIRNPKAGTLHVMLRISGDRIIHCTGWKYNYNTGVERWETYGAIRVDTIQNFFLDMLGVYPFHNFDAWWVVRILDAIDPEKYPLTEATLSRMENPFLNIDFTSSVRGYQNVRPGDCITYTLRIRNEQCRDVLSALENLPVEMTVPQGTELVETAIDSCTAYKDGKLTRTVTVWPVQEHTLQYTVRVCDVPAGTELKASASVANIPIETVPIYTTKNVLSLEDRLKLQNVTEGTGAAQVYETVLGKKVEIPSVEQLLDALYERADVDLYHEEDREEFKDNVLLKRKANAAHPAEAMMVPGLLGGRSLSEVSQYDRVLEIRGEYLCPGDVVLAAKSLKKDSLEGAEEVLILGGNKMLKNGEVVDVPHMDCLFSNDYFVILRPVLAE